MVNLNALGSIGMSGMSAGFGGYRGYAADNQQKLFKALESRLGTDEAVRYTGVSREEAAAASASPSGSAADARNFVQSYTKEMTRLKSAAGDLLSADKRSVSASSSDTAVLQGSIGWRSAKPGTYEIDVSQIATSQVSRSAGIDSTASNSIAAQGQFKLSTAKGDFEVDMSKYAGAATNQEALKALADDINKSGLGVTATTEFKDGQVSLQLKSDETGEAAAFKAQGTFGVSSGLSQPVQAAQNAEYTVDGKAYSSGSNKIQLDTYRVDVTLKGAGSAKLTVGADPADTVDKVETLLKAYNGTLKFLNDNYAKGTGVIRQMGNMLHLPISEDSLKSIGVTVGKDGTMSVDKDILMDSLKRDPEGTKALVSGSYSLAQGVMNDANQGLSISSAKLTEGMRPADSPERAAIKQQFGGYTYGRSSYQMMLNYGSMGALLNTLI